MPLQQILPTWVTLNGANDTSPTGQASIVDGSPIFGGGLNLGDYFDLTEKEANDHSDPDVGILHSGRYRRIQVHEGATAANVARGRVGLQVTSLIPEMNIFTSADLGLATRRIVFFLNTIDPGNYGFVQEAGIITGLCTAVIGTVNPTGGAMLYAAPRDGRLGTSTGVMTVAHWLEMPSPNAYVMVEPHLCPYQG